MSSSLSSSDISSKIATDQNIIDKTSGALLDASRVEGGSLINLDSDVMLATINAIKNYIGNISAGGVTWHGDIVLPAVFATDTSNNYLASNTDVKNGDMFYASTSGNLTMADGDILVEKGDALIVDIDGAKTSITKAQILDISPTYPRTNVGDVKVSWVSIDHDGWLLQDGSEKSRTAYPLLFGFLGTSQGVGDGSTTFNLPDSRGRAIAGTGQGVGLTNRGIGEKFGTENETLDTSQIPSHLHTNNHGHSHNHTVSDINPGGKTSVGGPGIFGGNKDVYDSEETNTQTTSTKSLSYTGNTGSAGGGQPHNNVQPTIAMNIFIYAGV